MWLSGILLAELFLIRLEVITGGLHDWAAKGISFFCSDRTKQQGFSSAYIFRTPWLSPPFLSCFSFTSSSSLYLFPSHPLHTSMHVHSMCCTCARESESLSCVVFDSASNKRRTWLLLFFSLSSISKVGHERYSAASNYQPCGRIEGKKWRGAREE